MFLTTAAVDEAIVYELVKSVFNNLEEFKKLHPAFEGLNPKNMLKGMTAPLHPGAIKYYKEQNIAIPSEVKAYSPKLN